MSAQEIVDAGLRFLEIMISWPVLMLILIFAVRNQLPSLVSNLAERITKAPGGFEFAILEQVQEQVATIQETIERIEQEIRFVPSPDLTTEIKQGLDQTLRRYLAYMNGLGFKPKADHINIDIRAMDVPNAWYMDQTNTISISPEFAEDPDVAIREYNHHALSYSVGSSWGTWNRTYQALEHGLADYFTCSFMNQPLLGEIVARKLYERPYIRNLDNRQAFGDISFEHGSAVHSLGEVWGGLFWELRRQLGPGLADQLLFDTWSTLQPTDLESKEAISFTRALLNRVSPERQQQVREIFARRGVETESSTGVDRRP